MTLLKGNDILNKTQCDVLRGVAIIGIFVHNFCHWLHGSHLENEFCFYKGNSVKVWNYWTGDIDQFAPIQFFSFFGHYGVPMFLFLSGFGLVMKYERQGASHVKTLPFLGYQWLKLFRLMILGYILSVVVYDVWCDFEPHPWNEVIAQLALIVNAIFQNPGSAVLPGPYWFFGLMLEIYVIYILFLYPSHNKPQSVWRWLIPVILIIVAWLLMIPQELHHMRLNYLRYNVAVGILPFCMGVLVARYGLPRLNKWLLAAIAVFSLPGLSVVNLNYQTWLWAPVLVVAGSVAFVKLFNNSSYVANGIIMKPLAWVGTISSFIFVVLSIPRMPMFKFALWKQSHLMNSDYLWILSYIVLTILLAWLYKIYLNYVPSPKLHTDGSISFFLPYKKDSYSSTIKNEK